MREQSGPVCAAKFNRPGSSTPIVAVSASVFEADGASVLSSGAADFVRKPFRAERIFQVLEEQLGIDFVREGPEEPETTAGAEPSDEAVEVSDVALTREHLALLPPQLIVEMRAATTAVDFDRLQELFDEVVRTDAALARGLRHLLRNYDYEGLSALFSPDDSGS